jgi:hypothetical protein
MAEAPEKKAEAAVEAAKAEALGRRQEDGSVVVPLVTDEGTVEVTLAHPTLWYEGAVQHLTAGRITEWVRLAVADEESRVRYDSVRKRYRDLDNFLTAWSQATGETPGESQGSSDS